MDYYHYMQKTIWVVLCLGFVFIYASVAFAIPFNELKGEHYIIYYTGERLYAENVMTRAEDYYDSICRRLGYVRYDNFWLWEKRCRIYIYASAQEYQKETHFPHWSGGHAVLAKRSIYSFIGRSDFLDGLLPHEVTHLMFTDYVGSESNVALWLHEGVAMSSEKIRSRKLFEIAKTQFSLGRYIPFQEITRIRTVSTMTDTHMVALFYAESLSAVTYLLKKYYSDRFIQFCRDIRDGNSLPHALERNYGQEGIKDLPTLEENVKKFIQQESLESLMQP
jgi:hypothetical protein